MDTSPPLRGFCACRGSPWDTQPEGTWLPGSWYLVEAWGLHFLKGLQVRGVQPAGPGGSRGSQEPMAHEHCSGGMDPPFSMGLRWKGLLPKVWKVLGNVMLAKFWRRPSPLLGPPPQVVCLPWRTHLTSPGTSL